MAKLAGSSNPKRLENTVQRLAGLSDRTEANWLLGPGQLKHLFSKSCQTLRFLRSLQSLSTEFPFDASIQELRTVASERRQASESHRGLQRHKDWTVHDIIVAHERLKARADSAGIAENLGEERGNSTDDDTSSQSGSQPSTPSECQDDPHLPIQSTGETHVEDFRTTHMGKQANRGIKRKTSPSAETRAPRALRFADADSLDIVLLEHHPDENTLQQASSDAEEEEQDIEVGRITRGQYDIADIPSSPAAAVLPSSPSTYIAPESSEGSKIASLVDDAFITPDRVSFQMFDPCIEQDVGSPSSAAPLHFPKMNNETCIDLTSISNDADQGTDERKYDATHEDCISAMDSLNSQNPLTAHAIDCVLRTFATSVFRVIHPSYVGAVMKQSRRPLRLNGVTKILVPLHQNNHWTVSLLDITQKKIDFYDSLMRDSHAKDAESKIRVFIQDQVCSRNTVENTSEWTFSSCACCQQTNGYDCGVYTLINSLHLMAGCGLPTDANCTSWRQIFRACISAYLPDPQFPDPPTIPIPEKIKLPQPSTTTEPQTALQGMMPGTVSLKQLLQHARTTIQDTKKTLAQHHAKVSAGRATISVLGTLIAQAPSTSELTLRCTSAREDAQKAKSALAITAELLPWDGKNEVIDGLHRAVAKKDWDHNEATRQLELAETRKRVAARTLEAAREIGAGFEADLKLVEDERREIREEIVRLREEFEM